MFGLPLFKARNVFTSTQTENNTNNSSADPTYYHPTIVKSYKVKFGNPFPGPSHNVSHHCVELVYLFDAFHDDLIKIDNIEHALADQLTPPLDDKVHDNLSQQNVPEQIISALAKKRSNVALQKDIQRYWIHFITKEQSGMDKLRERGLEDQVTVFDVDREVRVGSLSKDEEWVQQAKRFEVLARYPDANKGVLKKLTQQLLI
jgi:hypothetical protein